MLKRYYLILLLLISLAVQAENDRAFFWQVTSENTTVYLLGSIHFADKSFYPLRKEIIDSFNRSETLVVELNVNEIDPNAYNKILNESGTYRDGKTIKDVVSTETLSQLKQQLQQLGISYEEVKTLKPGVLVLTLSAMQIMQMGFNPDLGIDVYFLNEAASNKSSKEIAELETLQQQINLFLEIPDGELLLKESLYSMDESEAMMANLIRYWKTGDEVAMEKLLFQDTAKDYPEFGKIYDRLFYSRNNEMLGKIENMLKQKSASYFLVVGTGHLIGDKGIVGLLKNKGYEVKRL